MNGSLGNNESGVSPVIGVMLMIVVTVIIAAVVSSFAGGLTDTSTDVPIASFDFKVYEKFIHATTGDSSGTPKVVANMKSGEAIDTSDLKIVSYWEDDDGNIHSHTFTGGKYAGFGSTSGPFSSPMFGCEGAYWHTGDQYVGSPSDVLGKTVVRGEMVEIQMVHEPTNTVIWSDEVTVI